jgi:hypothetical protein
VGFVRSAIIRTTYETIKSTVLNGNKLPKSVKCQVWIQLERAFLEEYRSMHEITVEPALGAKLGQLAGQVILCDAQGRALGFFSPMPDHPLVKDLQLEPPSSIEELQELRKVRSGKPLEEILTRFGL